MQNEELQNEKFVHNEVCVIVSAERMRATGLVDLFTFITLLFLFCTQTVRYSYTLTPTCLFTRSLIHSLNIK